MSLNFVKKDFFISFNKADKGWADWIAFQLDEHGYSITYQNWDWGPGSDFVLEMQKAAQECERTLIVLSPSYLSSLYTQPEWSQAFARDPTGDKRLLVPVRVEKCELTGFFSTRVYIDFLEPPPDEQTTRRDHLLEKLLDGIKLKRNKPSEEPPLPGEQRANVDICTISTNPSHAIQEGDNNTHHANPKFYGNQRENILLDLANGWIIEGPVVSILQGFPGTGKSQLAAEVASKFPKSIVPVEPTSGTDDPVSDLLIELASSLDNDGIPDLLREVGKGKHGDPYSTLFRIIRHTPILIIIDEFQRIFASSNTYPPRPWERLIEKLNNTRTSRGRLLLISNRLVKNSRWNENCNSIVLNGLSDKEAEEYFYDLLDSRGLISKVPTSRLSEIGHRLGGNPRAIKTLVSGLVSDSLDNLLSLSPDLFSTGDVKIDSHLVEDFEREIIERTLAHVESKLLRFLRWASVHRRPFDKSALIEYKGCQTESYNLRQQLIDRFLITNSSLGDELHPLVREVSITRLSEESDEWVKAHNLAANYHLDRFKVSQKIGTKKIATSYVELRHHLYEARRTKELHKLSDRLIKFALSHIDKPAQSKVPENTEILEERIALISAMPDDDRPKGLEFHLALCLKHRSIGDDYKNALFHVRKATGPRAYYAVWLLLIELEYSINGINAMLKAQKEALKYLGNGSNSFSVYHRCSQILSIDNKTNEAINLLEKGINTPGVTCLSSLIRLCTEYMEASGRIQDAINLIDSKLSDEDIPEPGILYKRCANLMASNNQLDEAINLLRNAITKPGMTKVYSIYLLCSELLYKSGRKDEAVNILKEGIANCDVRDPLEIYRKCAEMLVKQGQPEEAITILEGGLTNKSIRDPERLYIYFAEFMEKLGQPDYAASILKRTLLTRDNPSTFLYLSCAKILFHMRNLNEAIDVLKTGISRPKMKEKRQLIQMCAELLFRQGQINEGLGILTNGIEDPAIENKFALYHACSNLMVKEGRLKDAIKILTEGINAPAIKNKSVLIQACAKLLDRDGRRNEAVELLQASFNKPGITGVAPLYQICAKIMVKDRRRKDAIRLLSDAIKGPRIGNLASLYQLCAELMVKEGQKSKAKELVTEGINIYPKDKSLKDYLKRIT